jgi:hypothetical protein
MCFHLRYYCSGKGPSKRGRVFTHLQYLYHGGLVVCGRRSCYASTWSIVFWGPWKICFMSTIYPCSRCAKWIKNQNDWTCLFAWSYHLELHDAILFLSLGIISLVHHFLPSILFFLSFDVQTTYLHSVGERC